MTNRQKRLLLDVVLIFTLNLLLIALAKDAYADLYKRGAYGPTVTEIQTRLKSWGYYDGSIDGVYGSGTEAAIRRFQQANGLSADGQAGAKTLYALGLPNGDPTGGSGGGQSGTNSPAKGAEGDVDLLARLISAEARGEPYNGQVAVGAVVMNRVSHPSFPDTIAGVIYQTDAFTCIVDGQFDQPVADSAYRAAQDALNGSDPTGGAIYYFNPATATSAWIWSRPLIVTIGRHRFCA